MNIFDNQKYYNKDEFDKVSYDDQKELFIRIRRWVSTVDYETKYLKDKYKNLILKRIEQICAYACSGHIPSQDYMGYVYKRGFGDFFPVNYKRSLEWNIIAAVNGSKLAPQKMKTFMNPAVDMILLSPRSNQIIEYNDLNYNNYFWFLSQYICEILFQELHLDPVEMSKENLIEEDTNENRTRIFFDRFRNKSVEKAIENLIKQLPEDMPNDENNSKGEKLLGGTEEDEDLNDMNIEIEDIDN